MGFEDEANNDLGGLAMHNDRIATIGMDLGKRSFHLIGMDARGKVIMRQQLSRGQFERDMANLQPCLVGSSLRGARRIGRRWRRLDDRVDALTSEVQALARQDEGCRRLMSVPGIGALTASAVVATIGNGAAFTKGRDWSLARAGAETTLHRRQTVTWPAQQTR